MPELTPNPLNNCAQVKEEFIDTLLVPEKRAGAQVVQLSNQLEISEIRASVFAAGVFPLALAVVLTGKIPIYDADGVESSEEVAQSVRIDLMVKLLNKAIPNAKEQHEQGEPPDVAKWIEIMSKQQAIITREDALKAGREERGPLPDAPGRRK